MKFLELLFCKESSLNFNSNIKRIWAIKYQSCPHIETSQLFCCANQLTGFNMRATLAFTRLGKLIDFYSPWNYQKNIGLLMISGRLELICLNSSKISSKIWRLSLNYLRVATYENCSEKNDFSVDETLLIYSLFGKDANLWNKVLGSWNDPFYEILSISHYKFHDLFQRFDEQLSTKTTPNEMFFKTLTL